MMANKSYDYLLRHLGGVEAILIDRGVENLQSPTSRRTFYEYRSIHRPISLAARKSNFLSLPEWIDPPWKASEPHSTTYLQTISDVAFQLPILMERFDRSRGSMQHFKLERNTNDRIMDTLIQDALDIQLELDRWERRLRAGNDISQFCIPRLSRTVESPKIDDLGNIFPVSYGYPNWDIASGLIYWDMVQIFLNTFLLGVVDYTNRHDILLPTLAMLNARDVRKKSIEAADRLCSSIEWFFKDNKRLIGRMVILAQFKSARSLYARLLKEGAKDELCHEELVRKSLFCEKVTERIQEGGLPIWAKSGP